MGWRLGLDLGANSLGWAALVLDGAGRPCGIISAGARIFSNGRNPQSKQSLALDRRAARAMRRNRDRYLRRRTRLLRQLTEDGLLPGNPHERAALARLDPFKLRARALDGPLAPPELGRVLFHLNQRRGFKSNRKTDRGRGDDQDAGKIATGVDRLVAAMDAQGARTLAAIAALATVASAYAAPVEIVVPGAGRTSALGIDDARAIVGTLPRPTA